MGITHREIIHWYTQTLPQKTFKALEYLSQQKWLEHTQWYLAGGTAFALHAGHRQSLDLDFFIPSKNISLNALLKHFPENIWTTDIAQEGTVYGRLFGAKVSFIAYPFFVRMEQPSFYGSVRVLHPRDIAVMKIIAISQRGRKRDFIDLFWYVQNREPINKLLYLLPDQYPTVAHNYHHIIKSLTYFADAESDPMPKLFFKATWQEIKKYFQKEAPRLAKELLGLH